MMNKLGVVLLATTLTACAGNWRDDNGNEVPQEVYFNCKQGCGVYSMQEGLVPGRICVRQCLEAKGYHYE